MRNQNNTIYYIAGTHKKNVLVYWNGGFRVFMANDKKVIVTLKNYFCEL